MSSLMESSFAKLRYNVNCSVIKTLGKLSRVTHRFFSVSALVVHCHSYRDIALRINFNNKLEKLPSKRHGIAHLSVSCTGHIEYLT